MVSRVSTYAYRGSDGSDWMRRFGARHRAALVAGVAAAALLLAVAVGSDAGVAQETNGAIARSPEARRYLAEAFVQKAKLAEKEGRWAEAAAYYARARVEHDRPDARWGAVIAENQLLLPGPDIPVPEGIWTVVSSPNGRLALVTTKQEVASEDLNPGKANEFRWAAHRLALIDVESGKRAFDIGSGVAAFRPDGEVLAVGGPDAVLRLWDLSTGQEIRSLGLHPDRILEVAWSGDGRRLATATSGGKVIVWEAETGSRERELVASDSRSFPAFEIGFSDGDGELIAATPDRIVVWDTETGSVRLQEKGGIFRSAGRTLSIEDSGGISVFDLASARRVGRVKSSAVSSLSVSTYGRWVAALDAHRSRLWVWDRSTHKGEWQGISLVAGSVYPSSSGDLVAVLDSRNRRLVIRDAFLQHDLLSLSIEWHETEVTFSGDERRLLTWGHEPLQGRGVLRARDASAMSRGDLIDVWNPMRFSPDGKSLAAGVVGEGLYLWDVPARRPAAKLKPEDATTAAGSPVWCISPDLGQTATLSKSGSVEVRDAATGEAVASIDLHGASDVMTLEFSPDGGTLLIADPASITLWSMRERRIVASLAATEMGSATAFSPDGTRLAVVESNGATVIDVTTGAKVAHFPDDSIWALAFTPDGQSLAISGVAPALSGGGARTLIRDVASGSVLHELNLAGGAPYGLGVRSIAFSPDGSTLALGDNGSVRLFDVQGGREVGAFHASVLYPESGVLVAFSPDGGTLAVGTERTGLHFYDVPSPSEHLARILRKNRFRLDGLDVVPAE